MKTTLIAATVLVLALTLPSCKGKKDMNNALTTQQGDAVKGEVEADDSNGQVEVKPVMVDPSYRTRETDPYTIESAEMDGDVMLVTVQYSGGCKEHVFEMMTNGIYLKSMPPQVQLTLEHESNDDNCRAMISKTYAFDVSGLQYKGSKEVRLKVNGETGKEVLYTYK